MGTHTVVEVDELLGPAGAAAVVDLRERGLVEGEVPADQELCLRIIDTYIRFPTPTG